MQKTQPKEKGLSIIPLGGLGEVGRNMMLMEWESKILIIDMGFRFPEEDMPGVDFIIPNVSYLKGREKDIVGLVITHGHYDHIGAIPYMLNKLKPGLPIFASSIARGIILKRQEDFRGQPKLNFEEVKDGSRVNLNPFSVEFFHENHNIPANLGLFISTPIGNIVHTSDFKFDETPINDAPTNFKKLKNFGKQKVLLLMSDSTGAETEGHSLSEKTISENLDEIFQKSQGRIIAATFSSLINRIQQLIFLSEKHGRRVFIEGYSMKTNVEISKALGFIKAKKGTIVPTKEISRYPDQKITVICTGAQGEDQASLMKIATKEHQFIQLKKGDAVIFSSSVIPGNEKTVQILKDEILRQKTTVYHYKMMDIHAGGHAQAEELKEMINMMNPKFFMPIHGQYSMLVAHGEIAKNAGIPEENIVIAENGEVISITKNKIEIEKRSVTSYYIMVDGLGIGDVGEIVLRDRQTLAEDGMFVIIVVVNRQTGKIKGSPDIISRGFIYLRESKELLAQTRKKVIDIVNQATGSEGIVNWAYIKDEIRNKVGQYLYSKTQRRPMILPVVIEI
ncbi:MAG: ribonuclease J [bacterium]